jgi:hypothetical protein
VNPVTGSPAPDCNIIVHKLCLDTSGIGEGGVLRCNDLIPSTPAKRKHAATTAAASGTTSTLTAASTGLGSSSGAQGAKKGDSMDVEVQETEPETEPSWDAAIAEAAAKRPRNEEEAQRSPTVKTETVKTETVKEQTVNDEMAEQQL